MRIHILGVGGTFMAGIAAIAKALGHQVTGSDQAIYPPMSDQLRTLDIGWHEGYDDRFLDTAPELVIVGNALSRGNPAIEALLNRAIPYTSGPEWLSREVLAERWVLAVAGTHGKTTTSSLLAWILEDCGLAPGFLIGGMPTNFASSARLGNSPFFVIEADEYDTAFFDKRAKFVHYRPRTAILHNLEYDHADIYPDMAAIRRQFHHLVRTVPSEGKLIVPANDQELAETLDMGVWTPIEWLHANPGWQIGARSPDGRKFEVCLNATVAGEVTWDLLGAHNQHNALAAIAAARHAGVAPRDAISAVNRFQGVRRRLQKRGEAGGITVYDDFAHHPSAIRTTLEGLRAAEAGRLVAVLEPRSNTMRLGVHQATLAPALGLADRVFVYAPVDLGWDVSRALAPLGGRATVAATHEALLEALVSDLCPGDQVVVMSNGGFGALHDRLLARLSKQGIAIS